MNEAGNDGTGNALAVLSGEIADAVRRAGQCLAVAIEGMPASALDYAQLYNVREQARSVAAVAMDVHLVLTNERPVGTPYSPRVFRLTHDHPSG